MQRVLQKLSNILRMEKWRAEKFCFSSFMPKHILNRETWNRKEHFIFFNKFEDPYFGLTFDVDVTAARLFCKENSLPFFLYYHFLATRVANKIEPFRMRIEGDDVVVYETIHASTTIMREDKTFSFSYISFKEDLNKFIQEGLAEIKRIQTTTGIGLEGNPERRDIIHFSTIPWIPFKGLTHARSFSFKDSAPKISFGKIIRNGEKELMPVSIFSNHALVDGYHVGDFYEQFQELLLNP